MNGSEPDVTAEVGAADVVRLVAATGVVLGLVGLVGAVGVVLGLVEVVGEVGVVLGLVGVVEPTDWHNCGLYCWHVELCPIATLGSANENRTPTSAETRFMKPS